MISVPSIPKCPNAVYPDQWISWGDFLGANFIPTQDREYCSFEEAREYARGLELKGEHEWRQWCLSGKRPDHVPATPANIYKDNGWDGWKDFLGNKGNRPKDVDAWVQIAEKISADNGGMLPTVAYLQENGYSALVFNMKKYPDKFSHLQQESKKGRSVDEWVKVAEELTKKDGELPHGNWLRLNGYSGLKRCMEQYPDAFSHIQQVSKRKTIEEYVFDAEQIAKVNGGVVQTDDVNLKRTIARFPEKFSHLKVAKEKRTSDEWLVLADKLLKEQGVFPSKNWLKQNGYGGLAHMMQRHPIIFVKYIEMPSNDRRYKSWFDFGHARNIARSLKLKTSRDWFKYTKSGKKADQMPANPQAIYKHQWKGWRDWLGND